MHSRSECYRSTTSSSASQTAVSCSGSWPDSAGGAANRRHATLSSNGAAAAGRRVIFPSLHDTPSKWGSQATDKDRQAVSSQGRTIQGRMGHGILGSNVNRSNVRTSRPTTDTFVTLGQQRDRVKSPRNCHSHRRANAEPEQRFPACINFPSLERQGSVCGRTKTLKGFRLSSTVDAFALSATSDEDAANSSTGNDPCSLRLSLPPILRKESQRRYGSVAREEDTEGTSISCEENASEVSSVVSDIPSLDASSVSTATTTTTEKGGSVFRSSSFGERSYGTSTRSNILETAHGKENDISSTCNRQVRRRRVQFQLQVRVRDFKRSAFEQGQMWFTRQEMHSFKTAALQRILEYNLEMGASSSSSSSAPAATPMSIASYTRMTATGTGRVIVPPSRYASLIPRRVSVPDKAPKSPLQQPKSPSSAVHSRKKVLFTHRALSPDSIEPTLDDSNSSDSTAAADPSVLIQDLSNDYRMLDSPRCNGTTSSLLRSLTCGDLTVASDESIVKDILVVDSHDICLTLFAKGLHRMFPQATVTTARTIEQALEYAYTKDGRTKISFDLVIVEERLRHRLCKPSTGRLSTAATASGSSLLREMVSRQEKSLYSSRHGLDSLLVAGPLYIGVSAHVNEDGAKLKEHGADIVWSKPPPSMDRCLRDAIVDAIRAKRKVPILLG